MQKANLNFSIINQQVRFSLPGSDASHLGIIASFTKSGIVLIVTEHPIKYKPHDSKKIITGTKFSVPCEDAVLYGDILKS